MPQLSEELEAVRHRAGPGRGRQAPFGADVNLERYAALQPGSRHDMPSCRDALLEVGVDPDGAGRSGTYLQADRDVLCRRVCVPLEDRVRILPLADALETRPEAAGVWWRLVDPGADKYTAHVALQGPEGCYLEVSPGTRIEEPVQACFFMGRSGSVQSVHNVIVIGEGASVHLITGCTSNSAVADGLHLGVTECLVRRHASLTFTMIHGWGESFHVRPRSAVVVEEGGTFVSNYVLLKPLRSLQMFPSAHLRGRGARCRFQSLIAGRGEAALDIGSRIVHAGDDTASEIISRALASDRSSITARGRIEARTDRCRGHLECLGMIHSRKASMVAVPELDVAGAPHADLSHEAAISPIAEEEVAYLMSRGVPRGEALAMITRGFLDVGLLGLPEPLQRAVDELLAAVAASPGM